MTDDPAATASGRRTFHRTPEPVWATPAAADVYRPEAFATIRCTDAESNPFAVANAFSRGDPRPCVGLVIDLERVAVPVSYEDPEGIFPDVYELLNHEAVV